MNISKQVGNQAHLLVIEQSSKSYLRRIVEKVKSYFLVIDL